LRRKLHVAAKDANEHDDRKDEQLLRIGVSL
jgi:hypothetical protein